ncbi:MAG: cache domain-containing protein [Salinivirgaceae bacterium]|nr:cache domain-containing protein [Salinivirgaceae bacterium]
MSKSMNAIIKYLSNLSVRYKILIGYTVAFILFFAISGLIVYPIMQKTINKNIESELNNTTKTILSMVKAAADASINGYLRAVAEKNKDIVKGAYLLYKNGVLSENEAKEYAKSILLSQKIGKTGYIYCLDSKGIIKVHPSEALIGADLTQYDFIQKQLKKKVGYIEYEWNNPGESTARLKALYMTYFKEWDWIISASSYREEFNQLIEIENFRESILSIQFGKTGYSYVIDSKGTLIIHPFQEGENIYNAKDANGRLFVQELCQNKNGQIIYPWQNPHDPIVREKLVIFNYIPEYDWIVASSSYIKEFYEPIMKIWYIILVVFIAVLFFLFSLTAWYSRFISNTLNKLIQGFQKGGEGDFKVRISKTSEDEIGRLSDYFNNFMIKLDTYHSSLQQEMEKRKKASEALKNSERRLVDIINFLPDATFAIDLKGRVTIWNKTAEELTGTLASDMLNKGNYEYAIPFYGERRPILIDLILKPSEEIEKLYPHIKRVGAQIEGEVYQQNFKNGEIYMLGTAAILYDSDGNKTGAIESIRDITDRKKVEEALKESYNSLEQKVKERTREINKQKETLLTQADVLALTNKELEQHKNHLEDLVKTRTIELEKAKEKAEESDRLKSAFLANMSHEIRTPMNAIVGFSNLLSNQIIDNETKSYVSSIQKSSKSLLSLIGDILDLSEIEAGNIEMNLEWIEPKQFFKDIKALFDHRIENADLNFKFELQEPLPLGILIDAVRIRQIAVNLLNNAVKFTNEGFVKFSVEFSEYKKSDKKYIDLSFFVEDSGIGISEEYQQKLFQAFSQQNVHSIRKHGGTGLGLALCKLLVNLMNGTIKVKSEPGRGSLFTINLPQIEITNEYQVKKQTQTIEVDSIRFYPAKVLVVDDVEFNRTYIKRILKETDLQLSFAENGEQAYAIMESIPFDLVFTDIKMPVMDGFGLMKKIKENASMSNIPVIALSSLAKRQEQEQIQNAGFAGYLIKPFKVDELYAKMVEHLSHNKIASIPMEETIQDVKESTLSKSETEAMIQELNGSIMTMWKEFEEQQPMDEVGIFAHELKKLAVVYPHPKLILFAQKLIDAVDSFDIEELLRHLKRYPKLLKEITQ